jgi:hypothetical protein
MKIWKKYFLGKIRLLRVTDIGGNDLSVDEFATCLKIKREIRNKYFRVGVIPISIELNLIYFITILQLVIILI